MKSTSEKLAELRKKVREYLAAIAKPETRPADRGRLLAEIRSMVE